MKNQMLKPQAPINFDKFHDDEYICWVEVSNVPSKFKEKAKEIDKVYYNETCFGVCIVKTTEEQELWNAVRENSIGDLFYIDINGNKNWFEYELSENEEELMIDYCRNYIKENNL